MTQITTSTYTQLPVAWSSAQAYFSQDRVSSKQKTESWGKCDLSIFLNADKSTNQYAGD